METEQQPQAPAPKQRIFIPLWVALVGMVVSLIVAVIIMATILRPLINLVFPTSAQPPLPAQIELVQEVSDPRTSDGEWLYGTQADGCAVAMFYESQGSTCIYTPFICAGDVYIDGRTATTGEKTGRVSKIAECTGSHSDVVNSYSWEVLISSGYTRDYYTRFRVYLYRER